MEGLLNKVKEYIKTNNLINDNQKVILAFSYGIDSRVLLDILTKLGYEVIVAHVNHKVRKESDLEELETIKLCESLNIKYYIKHLTPEDKNFEDYARKERYNFFKDVAAKSDTNILITAHHKDDNLETILLKLMTGSNLYGYSGIHNCVIKDGLKIIRPFLCASKDEIKEYQAKNNLLYFEDYTNFETIHMRNKIRNKVIPLLKEINSSILDKASEYSEIAFETFNYIRHLSKDYLDKHNNQIEISSFKKLDIAIQKDIICMMLEKLKLNRNFKLINSILNMITNSKSQQEINISESFLFVKRYNIAYINKKIDKIELDKTINLGETLTFFNHKIYFTKDKPNSWQNYIKLCYNKVKLPLRIRTRINGDIIELSSGKKKVKDLLIDKKIPIEIRNTLPMVINDKDIIWIPSIAKSALIKDDLGDGDIYLIDEEN